MKKYVSLTLAALLLLSLLTGCGGASSAPQSMDYAVKEEAMAEAPMAAVPMEDTAANSLTGAGASGSTAIPENRKWIITVDMSAETEDLETLLAAVDERIKSMNGYVEDQNIYNGSAYSNRRYRSASLTVRIPAADVDKFTQEVSGIANVVRSSKNLEDITLSYTATASRIKALETEEERLLDFMEKAENMADLLEIEARLTDVRYELERYSSQLRLYDNQVDYATIYLNIEEVQEYTPVEEETFWQRITGGFKSSLKGLGEDVTDIVVWIIVSSPYLLVYAIVIGGIVVIVKKAGKGRKGKKEKKQTPPQPEQKEE